MAARVMTEHEHSWQFVSHIDGCHFAMTVASCDCGATLRQTAETHTRRFGWTTKTAMWSLVLAAANCASARSRHSQMRSSRRERAWMDSDRLDGVLPHRDNGRWLMDSR
jgi:hypothetical protein